MEVKKVIRNLIKENINSLFGEERIPNPEASEFVDDKENFLGSHTYGEDIGDLGKMYVAYSYGEQHPLYVWVDKNEFKDLRSHETKNLVKEIEDDSAEIHLHNDKVDKKDGVWFYNEKPYYIEDKDGRVKANKWTEKHLADLRPNEKSQARETGYLTRLINDFKAKYNIGSNKHTSLEPGEK